MYLVPGQTKPDTVAEVCHCADRDGYPALAPEVAFAEQHVCHPMPAVEDDQSLNLPDGAVRGVHMLSGAMRVSSPPGPSRQETLLPRMNSADSLMVCSGS
jgi:hypothetical protein